MIFWKSLPKKHYAEFGRWASKDSGALTVAIQELVQRQKMFVVSFCTTYWKDRFFRRHLPVSPVRVYGVSSGNFYLQKIFF